MTKREQANAALAQLAARYQGESGYPAKDFPVLQSLVNAVVAALDEAQTIIDKLASLEAQETQNECEE